MFLLSGHKNVLQMFSKQVMVTSARFMFKNVNKCFNSNFFLN